MTDIFQKTPLESLVNALKKDILEQGGPQISTMRNYRFAILVYDSKEEFDLRRHIRRLGDALQGAGMTALTISLKDIFLELLRAEDPAALDSLVNRERRLHQKDPERALRHFEDEMNIYFEEPDGVAGAVVRAVDAFVAANPDAVDRAIIFINRLGALYPFFRSSYLLKYIDGKTHNIPVVLLYPGERKDVSSLSFMGELRADRDYRPRIYS